MVAIRSLATSLGAFVSSLRLSSENCGLSAVKIPLRETQLAALGAPTTPLSAISVAFGVQNYTCSATKKFESVGAVGEMFDISHLASVNDPLLFTVHQGLYDIWNSAPADVTVQDLIKTLPKELPKDLISGQHYFNKNAARGLDPIWDFRPLSKFNGNAEAVFVAKVLKKTPADDPKNVALVHLGKVSGDVADEVYRLFTVGGVPPESCDAPGTSISLKYTSQYWMYGGSLGL